MRFKPTALFWQDNTNNGLLVLEEFFVKKYGFDIELVRTIVVKYPYILSKTTEQLEAVFTTLESKGVLPQEAMKLIFDCPKLVSIDLEGAIEKTLHLFHLYHRIGQEEVMDVFRVFPYLFCCDTVKMKLFMAQFRKYRFTNEQILHVCKNSGGLLACKVTNMTGLFDFLGRNHGIKASYVIKILDTYPEFIMQNRRNLFTKKM